MLIAGWTSTLTRQYWTGGGGGGGAGRVVWQTVVPFFAYLLPAPVFSQQPGDQLPFGRIVATPHLGLA